jgi:HK97 family phage portal protein
MGQVKKVKQQAIEKKSRAERAQQVPWRRSPNGNSAYISGSTFAGACVTEDSALSLPPVRCAVDAIASQISLLPLHVYHRPTRQRVDEHPVALLLENPNPEVGYEDFWQSCMKDVLIHGNSYHEIVTTQGGEPAELHRIHPQYVEVLRTDAGALTYRIDGNKYLPPDQVFHIKGLGDGLAGLSPLTVSREAFSSMLAQERFAASFYRNGCRLTGTLSLPGELSDNGRKNLRESWANAYQGVANTAGVAVLEYGMSFTPLSCSPEDFQFLQTRQFSILQTAQIFNISPIWLLDYGRATWGNMTEVMGQFVRQTLQVWLNKITTEIKRKLLLGDPLHYAEHLTSAILQGNPKERYEVYGLALDKGILTVDEVRAKENLGPKPVEVTVEPVSDPVV